MLTQHKDIVSSAWKHAAAARRYAISDCVRRNCHDHAGYFDRCRVRKFGEHSLGRRVAVNSLQTNELVANEKGVNCWEPLTVMPRAISSQAPQECGEGSTTRAWSPERTVKPHECTPRKGRYSLDSWETMRSAGLNACAITKRPYSGKLEALSQFDVKRPVMQALKNDAVKTFDRAVQTQFNNCQLRVVATSTTSLTLTTNGTATATNSQAYNAAVHKLMVDLIKERNIPPYLGDDYISLAWPSTFRPLKNDMETLHQYTPPGLGLIMSGEIGRYENTRFVEQSNILKGVNNDGTAWTNNKSDWMYIFGEDTVMEGITIPEEIRAKIPCQNDEVFAQVA